MDSWGPRTGEGAAEGMALVPRPARDPLGHCPRKEPGGAPAQATPGGRRGAPVQPPASAPAPASRASWTERGSSAGRRGGERRPGRGRVSRGPKGPPTRRRRPGLRGQHPGQQQEEQRDSEPETPPCRGREGRAEAGVQGSTRRHRHSWGVPARLTAHGARRLEGAGSRLPAPWVRLCARARPAPPHPFPGSTSPAICHLGCCPLPLLPSQPRTVLIIL